MGDETVRFGMIADDGKITNERLIRLADIKACPHLIMVPEHFRDDGTCRCDDPEHTEMVDAGYEWRDGAWR